MPINWNDKEVLERLFVATLASIDNKININQVVYLYGQDMTYHALENRMRKWKKEATALKDEVAVREGTAKSPAKTCAKTSNANPTKDAVKTRRIAKKKVPAAANIKSKPLVEEDVLDSIRDEIVDDDEAVGDIDEFI